MKYENTFKAIDQILWKEQGCGSELDYLEQKSWMLFLKYLDDLETEREEEAELEGKTYKRLVSGFYRWSQWATPKKRDPQSSPLFWTSRLSKNSLSLWHGKLKYGLQICLII